MIKLCKHCNTTKAIEDFVLSKETKSGYRGICKLCFNAYYRKRRIEKHEIVRGYERKFHHKRRLKSEYGLSLDDFEILKQKHGGRCAICNSMDKLVIDHCHKTEKVRGLLCNKCNLALGLFSDDTLNLQEAINYLNQYRNDDD